MTSTQLLSGKSMPTLFGLTGRTNRESGKKTLWGKNEFNSSFPTALLCYMHSKQLAPVYLVLNRDLKVKHKKIPVPKLFGTDPTSEGTFFSFEDSNEDFAQFVDGPVPRSDIVIRDRNRSMKPVGGFEIKLTALPDNSTAHLTEDMQSCELVFRQPSIVHLALSIARQFTRERDKLLRRLSPVCSRIYNWRVGREVTQFTGALIHVLDELFVDINPRQSPLIVQPIWRSVGKASLLHENALDVFVWSNLAFAQLFIEDYKTSENSEEEPDTSGSQEMSRPERCIFWLVRMLYEFAQGRPINPSLIPNEMAYEYQTDKAFSVNGRRSYKYLKSSELVEPRIKKSEVRNIILNKGHQQLSPERRFDAAIVYSRGVF